MRGTYVVVDETGFLVDTTLEIVGELGLSTVTAFRLLAWFWMA